MSNDIKKLKFLRSDQNTNITAKDIRESFVWTPELMWNDTDRPSVLSGGSFINDIGRSYLAFKVITEIGDDPHRKSWRPRSTMDF